MLLLLARRGSTSAMLSEGLRLRQSSAGFPLRSCEVRGDGGGRDSDQEVTAAEAGDWIPDGEFTIGVRIDCFSIRASEEGKQISLAPGQTLAMLLGFQHKSITMITP